MTEKFRTSKRTEDSHGVTDRVCATGYTRKTY